MAPEKIALLIIFLTRRRTSVARASLSTSKDGAERRAAWVPQKMQMQRMGEAMNPAVKLELELKSCTIVASLLQLFQVLQTSLHTLSLHLEINLNRAIQFELTSYKYS